MEYWWLVRENLLDYVKLPVPDAIRIFTSGTHMYVDPVLLLISAAVFSVCYARVRGFRKLIKAFLLLWFVNTVLISLFTLLSLIGLAPVQLRPGPGLIVNMFSVSLVSAILSLSNVFGLMELLIDVIPKFLIASGAPTAMGLEVLSFILSLAVTVAAMVIFAIS